MPGKKGNITSKDYQAPLRRPGEKLEASTTQDGGKDSSSAPNESEKEIHVVSNVQVEDSASSQVPEEKPVDAEGHKPKELEEKVVQPQKTEPANTDVSEAKEETITTSSTKAENVDVKDTETSEVKTEALKTPELTNKIAKLSPFAAEFVPRAAFNLPSVVNVPEFVPKSFSLQNDRPALLHLQSDKPENELMNCVKDVLFGLTQSPGELDSYVSTLVKMLQKWLSTLNSLKGIVDLIFEYSITEPNFQYTAAKLCNLLSMEQNIVLKNGERFRSVFMNRCRDEHLSREASLKNPASTTRLLRFAMFEAELFCNYRPLGESQPLSVFHRGLLEMLITLLPNHSEECLKCIGKMLKMTGYLLDDPQLMVDKKGQKDKGRKEKVDKLFTEVEKLSKESTLPDSVKDLLSQVIKLRGTKWDSGSSEGLPGTMTVYPSDDGYFFSDYALGMNDRPSLLNLQSDKPENALMNCVNDVMFGLRESPGKLDSSVRTLANMLQKWLSTLNSLKEIVDLIFEHSITCTEPNFQHMAAKLCNLLSKEQNVVLKNGENFRSVFLNRCRDEHVSREASLQNPASTSRLLGFAMFEAELYCNYRPLGESEPLKVFHRGLIEMLITLLPNHSEECLKCIDKILKIIDGSSDSSSDSEDDNPLTSFIPVPSTQQKSPLRDEEEDDVMNIRGLLSKAISTVDDTTNRLNQNYVSAQEQEVAIEELHETRTILKRLECLLVRQEAKLDRLLHMNASFITGGPNSQSDQTLAL